MRISDWSSDVCSSDLHLPVSFVPLRIGFFDVASRRKDRSLSRWGLQTCLYRSTLAVSGKTCSEWSVIRRSLGQQLQPPLPFPRSYRGPLTGCQTHADDYVRATAEQIRAAPGPFPREHQPRLGLHQQLQAIWGTHNT